MDQSLDDSGWVCGVWGDVEIEIHWFLVDAEGEGSLWGEGDGEVEEVDRVRWFFYFPGNALVWVISKGVHGGVELGEVVVVEQLDDEGIIDVSAVEEVAVSLWKL